MMASPAPPPTIKEQSEFLRLLLWRASKRDGTMGPEVWMRLEPDDADMIKGIASRLERIAPHETAIRKLVNQK